MLPTELHAQTSVEMFRGLTRRLACVSIPCPARPADVSTPSATGQSVQPTSTLPRRSAWDGDTSD